MSRHLRTTLAAISAALLIGAALAAASVLQSNHSVHVRAQETELGPGSTEVVGIMLALDSPSMRRKYARTAGGDTAYVAHDLDCNRVGRQPDRKFPLHPMPDQDRIPNRGT